MARRTPSLRQVSLSEGGQNADRWLANWRRSRAVHLWGGNAFLWNTPTHRCHFKVSIGVAARV